MATGTVIQNKIPQLSTISIMLDYEIDNTLNTIKENRDLIRNMSAYYPENIEDIQHKNIEAKEINNNTNNGNINSKTNAKKRWKILAKVLKRNSEESISGGDDEENDDSFMASVRRFKSFDILQQNSLLDTNELKQINKTSNWFTYKIHLKENEYSVNIYHIQRQLTASDLMGFNNTGNICVWPSEEALTVYALSDIQNFCNKWILELGGGMTSLCGLMLAKYAKPYAVHLTDGNNLSIQNVQRSLCLNELSCYTKCSILKWENISLRLSYEYEKFDIILSADCLFFDDARTALVDTIWYYLAENGIALVMAPQRGNTLTDFVNECTKKGFNTHIIHRYNEIIWERHLELKLSHLYNEDIHYPVLIKLTKPKNIE